MTSHGVEDRGEIQFACEQGGEDVVRTFVAIAVVVGMMSGVGVVMHSCRDVRIYPMFR